MPSGQETEDPGGPGASDGVPAKRRLVGYWQRNDKGIKPIHQIAADQQIFFLRSRFEEHIKLLLPIRPSNLIGNIRSQHENETMIRITDYPQLSLIAWNRRADDLISDRDALALYERNWLMIDAPSLSDNERSLIDRLVEQCGKGVLHV